MVTQKTREIGIRIALGSSIQRAMLDIGTPGVRACIVGLVLGLIFCAGALRALRSALYGVGVYDLPTRIFVILTFASVVLVATVTPTLRIAGIDPAMTLRDE
jgi:ABC-type lipoprotein release transport system permease subunit